MNIQTKDLSECKHCLSTTTEFCTECGCCEFCHIKQIALTGFGSEEIYYCPAVKEKEEK